MTGAGLLGLAGAAWTGLPVIGAATIGAVPLGGLVPPGGDGVASIGLPVTIGIAFVGLGGLVGLPPCLSI